MKVQVNVNDDLVVEIDKYAKMLGVSRSALCSVWIGQGLLSYQKAYGVFDKLADSLTTKLIEEKKEGGAEKS